MISFRTQSVVQYNATNTFIFLYTGKVLQAERVLSRLRGTKGVKQELNRIILSCQKDESHGKEPAITSLAGTYYCRTALCLDISPCHMYVLNHF